MMRFGFSRLTIGAVLALATISAMPAAAQDNEVKGVDGGEGALANKYLPNPANAVVLERQVNEPTRRVLKLANGLTVILEQNKTAPVVACQIYIKAGSITEQEYLGCGISHVLEHLLVTGTQGRTVENGGNMSMLQSLGGDANAYTTLDHTCFHITTTTAKWKDAMTLLTSWTTTNEFTKADFDREYKVVQRELEMGESEAGRVFGKEIQANRYLVSPVQYPTIGFKPAFQKLTVDDARTYYHRMYVPDNMFVVVAGDIDLDDAEKFIAKGFSHVERQKVPAVSIPQEPEVAVARTVVGHADVRDARVNWQFPTVDLFNPDVYALDVLSDVLASGNSSVLVRKLRDEKRLVTSVASGSDTPRFADGSLSVFVTLAPGNIPAARQALIEELQKIIDQGVDPAELEKVKNQTAASMVFGNQTAEQQANRAGSDFLATGTINFTTEYVAKIKAVTPEQVNAAARKYVRFDHLITSILLPKGVNLPASTQQAAQVAQAQDVKRVKLPNGTTLLLCRNTSSPIVSMQLYTMGALLAENDANNGIGNAMMRLMSRGSGKYSYEETSRYFDETGGSFATSCGNNTFTVMASCLKENVAKTFDIFADAALNPTFSGAELEKVRPQLLTAVDRAVEDWSGEAIKFAKQTYFKDSPYKLMSVGRPEVVQKLTADDLRKHYETYFRDPERTVIAIYGDIDVDQMEKEAQRFAAVTPHDVTLASVSEAGKPGTYLNLTKKGTAAIVMGYGPGMTLESKDRDAMMLVQTIMGGYGSSLGSPLFETLRGKGLVYTVQASNIPGPMNIKGMFMILALGEPQNADEIVKIITQIVDETKEGKLFTDELIAKAKDQAITGQQLHDVTIASRATSQALDELMGLGYDYDKHFAERVNAITRDDLMRVSKLYLNTPVITITTPLAEK